MSLTDSPSNGEAIQLPPAERVAPHYSPPHSPVTQSQLAQPADRPVTALQQGVDNDPATLQAAAGSGTQGSPAASPSNPRRAPQRGPRRCRYFASKQGCRAGSACPFRHDAPASDSAAALGLSSDQSQRPAGSKTRPATSPRRPQTTPDTVARPLASAEALDPRQYQTSQIKRRYAAKLEDGSAGSSLRFSMAPSDPDFPFDIDAVECELRVPAGFPDHAKPSLRVSNRQMERGYQLNVERGFDTIWAELRQKTLLNAMKLLDRRLESLLSVEKAEFITIVANSAPHSNAAPSAAPHARPDAESAPDKTQPPDSPEPRPAPPSFERFEAARRKRSSETRSLEQRLGSDPQYLKEADGTMYVLPVEPRKRTELPTELRPIKSVRLFVPEVYDIEPCTVELLGVQGPSCEIVEAAFARRARQRPELSLMAHINHLSQSMHILATEKAEDPISAKATPLSAQLQRPTERGVSEPTRASDDIADTDKTHIKIIPRPPEWDLPGGEKEAASSETDTDDEFDSSETGESDAEEKDTQESAANALPRETGIMLSLPGLELFNVELLEVHLLSVTVKCNRCKEPADFHSIKPADPSSPTANTRTQNCRKCALDLSVSFRADLMHPSSQRAGYLDLDNCEPLDMLPSNFVPTCANCSTTHARPGVVSARASSDSLALCRGCHARMLFKLPQVHFLRVGPAARITRSLPRRTRRAGADAERARLGIVPGTELPRRGACGHYRKSYRWFRFGCCDKLYACDRCHDESADGAAHPQEFAARMVCGWCSREQRYRPDDCQFCGRSVVGRKGRGFWEGGQGTRDPARMSRKDPRKHKLARKMRADQQKAKEKNER